MPFCIYVDFESTSEQHFEVQDTSSPITTSVFVKQTTQIFGYYVKCGFDRSLSRYVTFIGNECIRNFIASVKSDALKMHIEFLNKLNMEKQLTKDEHDISESSTECHLCERPFYSYDPNESKMADYCHISGKFQGVAHKTCISKFRIPQHIPIVFHNLSDDTRNAIISCIKEHFKNDKLTLTSFDSEKNISFSQKIAKTIELRYIDSYRFMEASLQELAATLDDGKFAISRAIFKTYSCSELVRDHFINKDTSRPDAYLEKNVLIFADIFENFRNVCYRAYNLDPTHYYTTSDLAWDAMLKHTKINLELISDITIHHFLRKGFRNNITYCKPNHSTANNKYIETHDTDDESKYLVHLKVNNLFEWAMSQKLPFDKFKWLSKSEILEIDFVNLPIDSDYGYIFEVDIVIPEKFHESLKDFPFCPETIGNDKITQLDLNLNTKTKYVIHYAALQQCLTAGLNVSTIHRVLKFRQECWLKPFIDYNTHLEQNAVNEFDKLFFKIIFDAIFQRIIDKTDLQQDMKTMAIVCDQYEAEKLISQSNFRKCTILNENFVAIEMKDTTILHDKSIYIGLAVLDLTKYFIYDFHYNIMKNKYHDHIKLLYTDTYSFIYQIVTNDFYQDLKDDAALLEIFDSSEPDKIQPLGYSKTTMFGKFSDKNKGSFLMEFVALCAKVYATKIYTKSIKNEDGTIEPPVPALNHNGEMMTHGIARFCSRNRFENIRDKIYSENLVQCLF